MKLMKVLAMALILLPGAALAQEQGEAGPGLTYAKQACAECHWVDKEDGISPDPLAKNFKEIANRRDTTVISLAAWMQSEHENMPHIMPAPENLNDVITYIISLKK